MLQSETIELWGEPLDVTELAGELNDFDEPVLLRKVDGTPGEKIWDCLVRNYHYLSYGKMFGSRVKYLISLGTRLIGAISYCSASYKLGPRDVFVGWDEKTRLEYLPHLINNNRFLILPWVKIKNLASHTLSLSLKQVNEDWKKKYAVEPYMAETFVDGEKFSGSCYVAANWTYLGATKGFGRIGNSFVFHGNRKDIYVYVMSRSFNQIFRPDIRRLPDESEENLNLITDIPIPYEKLLGHFGISGIEHERLNRILADHISRYTQYLGRKEHKRHFIAVLKGILSDLDRKSCIRIAKTFEDGSEVRNFINFLTVSRFDDNGMLEEYAKDLGGLMSCPEGMITGDVYDCVKLGYQSVDVARQFCSGIGKMRNCQSSVIAGYSGVDWNASFDYRLYLPEQWHESEFQALRKICRVPETFEYMTKSQLMLEMVEKALHAGNMECKYIGVDSSFGNDHAFLDSIPECLIYFAEISKANRVFIGSPGNDGSEEIGDLRTSVENRKIRIAKVKDAIDESLSPWTSVARGSDDDENSNTLMDKCLKVIEFRKGMPKRQVWLYAMRFMDGSVKYALCNGDINASPDIVRGLAVKRWRVKQSLTECREVLGMDQNEVRSWIGWSRHILFTLIAHLFTVKIRCKTRDIDE
jgi:SRSO17 transposase